MPSLSTHINILFVAYTVLFIIFVPCFVVVVVVAMLIAQDLLDSWLHDKKDDDFNLQVQFKEEKWAQRSKPIHAVTRNSVAEGYYGDDVVQQSHDWTSGSSLNNHTPSLNIMGMSQDEFS